MPNATAHTMTLSYTIDDDGVWIDCSCGWRHCLGFDASPHTATSIADDHAEGSWRAPKATVLEPGQHLVLRIVDGPGDISL